MSIPIAEEKNRLAVYNYLFTEGALTAMANVDGPHHELEDIPNVEVIQAMKILHEHDMIYEYRSRSHFQWDINVEGVDFLRVLLGKPYTAEPKTMQSPTYMRRMYYFYLDKGILD